MMVLTGIRCQSQPVCVLRPHKSLPWHSDTWASMLSLTMHCSLLGPAVVWRTVSRSHDNIILSLKQARSGFKLGHKEYRNSCPVLSSPSLSCTNSTLPTNTSAMWNIFLLFQSTNFIFGLGPCPSLSPYGDFSRF